VAGGAVVAGSAAGGAAGAGCAASSAHTTVPNAQSITRAKPARIQADMSKSPVQGKR